MILSTCAVDVHGALYTYFASHQPSTVLLVARITGTVYTSTIYKYSIPYRYTPSLDPSGIDLSSVSLLHYVHRPDGGLHPSGTQITTTNPPLLLVDFNAVLLGRIPLILQKKKKESVR